VGECFNHESIIGTRFEGRLVAETTVGGRAAVIPAIKGRGWITGIMNYFVDPEDPFPAGYTVADTWGVAPRTQ
jgi:proline racemase